ncbi:MAG: hypothetical protein PHG81_11895 [Aliarcobacter sp.]|nr:hypothetical protein [Aliarcobacter sp.]
MKRNLTKLLVLTTLATSLNAEVQTVKNEIIVPINQIKNCPEKHKYTMNKNEISICNYNDKTFKMTFENKEEDIPFNRIINCKDKKNNGYRIITHSLYTKDVDKKFIKDGYIKNIYACTNEDKKLFIEIEDNTYNNEAISDLNKTK